MPLFQRQIDHVMARDADGPVRMKFLANTPLAQRRGINMLMPVVVVSEVPSQTGAGSSTDHQAAEVDQDVHMVGGATKPEPPDEPNIEDPEDEESEEGPMDVAGEDEPTVEALEKSTRPSA